MDIIERIRVFFKKGGQLKLYSINCLKRVAYMGGGTQLTVLSSYLRAFKKCSIFFLAL